MVNMVLYNLMNCYNKVMNHHISVVGSLNAIKVYEEISLDTAKINLGFIYYTK
jgi:chitinase